MKTLLMSLICTFMCFSLFAQVDSTNKNPNNTNPTVTPQTTTPTTNNNVTDSTTNMNSTNSNMNSNMNSTNSTMNSMNNRVDSAATANTINTPGQPNYAALPVLETYVPENIVAEVKQEHEGAYIYDITAVKAPMDSTMAQGNSMNQNATTMNANTTTTNTTTVTDSTAQNTTVATNTTGNTNSNGTMNQNSGRATTPQEYDYVVRYLQGGTMVSETLDNNGTKINRP